jgi:hypothetical protein
MRAGLVLGTVIGLWHLVWSLLVAIGWAQPVIDFVFWMHFLKPVYVVQPFNAATAAILVVATAAAGFVIGLIFGAIWKWTTLGRA